MNLRKELAYVRQLLGPLNNLVPDHLITELLDRNGRHWYTPFGAAAYIRLALAGPRRENERSKSEPA